MKKIIQEMLLVVIILIPLIQLYLMWNEIPDTIPLHYNIKGEVDDFGSKNTLSWFVPLVLITTNLLLFAAPWIDPKKRISFDNPSYYSIRLIVTLFLSSTFIAYHFALNNTWNFTLILPGLLFAFIILLGNFMPTIKPNYFIGLRTPWTLENKEVWNRTHRFSGKVWMLGGIIGLIASLLWPTLSITFVITIVGCLGIGSTAYSYFIYRNIKKENHSIV